LLLAVLKIELHNYFLMNEQMQVHLHTFPRFMQAAEMTRMNTGDKTQSSPRIVGSHYHSRASGFHKENLCACVPLQFAYVIR